MQDFIKVKKTVENKQGFNNKIQSKHIDFFIYDKDTLEIKLAIELDDKRNDLFKNNALKSANIKLVRIKCQKSYDCNKIKELIS